jgi:hypothetical protein
MALTKAQHAAGKRYEWNVTEPDVDISSNTAWIAYVNKGSITDASGTMDQKWLESALLEKREGVWKIVFMHSTAFPCRQQRAMANDITERGYRLPVCFSKCLIPRPAGIALADLSLQCDCHVASSA